MMTRRRSSVAALLAKLLVAATMTMAMAMAFDAAEPCDWTYVDGVAGDVRLDCKARTITDELGKTGFNVEGVSLSAVGQLKVACSDVLFFQSTLANDSFVNVPNIRRLDVEFCKINALPAAAFRGLDKLRELSLQTHNTEWSAMSLNIAPGAFETLKSLEALDLSQNNVWELPPGVFCNLPRLKTLNLTANRLQDVNELGFNAKPCAPELTKLDISSNEIESLPDDGFRGLAHLRHLLAQGNSISMVSDNAFAGLGNLQVLNVSSNKLVALPPQVFRHTKYIQEIYAFNNSISVLAPGLFDGLSHLVVLDLSHNDLSSEWLKADTFKDLTRLIVLSLSHNRLTEFKNHMVSSLYGLQILRLDHNHISFIGPGAFSALYNLHTLVLSHNSIMQLDAHHMTGLHVLSLLDLDHNQLASLHPDTFNNSSHLQDLNLSGNALNHVPKALQELKFLKTLDLGQNNISDLSGDPFKGLSQLYGLRLINNSIGDLSAEMFQSLPMLKILNLAHNRITSIAEGTLDQNQELQAVRLDGNFIRDINGVFTNLEKLIWLNVSDNYIEWFDYAIIPRSLEWLDVHKNQIRELGNYYGMENQLRLTTLEASFNKIAEISAKNLPNSLQLLFLNDNAIRNVAPYTFFDKVNLTRAYLYANQLSTLDLSALQLSPKEPSGSEDSSSAALSSLPPEFYIGGNPFQCDCKMEWLQRIGSLEHLPQVMDLDGVYCHLLFNRQRSFVPLVEVDSSQFLCNYHTHCFAICHCCDFDACDCEMTCPNNCTCYHDQSWAANIVDCTRAGYKGVPERIPMDSTEVYLDGNDIRVLKSHLFIGRKNMRVLFMNSSSVVTISNGTFNGLKNLKTLHLENNRLAQLHGFEFEGLDSLRELFLHDNELAVVNESVFAPLAALEILTMRNNRLVTFPVWSLTATNPYLFQIALAGNPWTCDCGHMSVFSQWIDENRAKIADASEVHCVQHNATAVAMVAGAGHKSDDHNNNNNNLTQCGGQSQPVIVVQADTLESHVTLVITGIVLGLVLIAFVMMAVVIRYRKELRVWAFANCGLRICQSSAYEGDSERLFDAFVTYSSKDEAFVTQKLAPELEQGGPSHYRLCLHYRDFPVSAYLADTIIGGVESSKRTLLVLSQNFLQSEWCRFEFKSALHQVLRDRQKRLVVVVYGDVPQRDLDPDLRLYLKASGACVHWGEKLFWEKLRFAMPDVKPQPSSSSSSSSHQTTAMTSTSINGAALANAAAIAAHHHHHLHHLHHHHHHNNSNNSNNGGVIDTVSTSMGTLVSSSNGRHSNNCPTYAEHTYATPKFDTASSTYGTTATHATMNTNQFHHHLQHQHLNNVAQGDQQQSLHSLPHGHAHPHHHLLHQHQHQHHLHVASMGSMAGAQQAPLNNGILWRPPDVHQVS